VTLSCRTEQATPFGERCGQLPAVSRTEERPHALPRCSVRTSDRTIELRLARPSEAEAIRRLAELDSSPELTGQVVIALINGDAVAGLSLVDQRVVANPFVPSGEAVALLRLRAEHLSGPPTHRKLPRVRRPRAAKAHRVIDGW
jgi:hypothetical protein